MINWQAKLDLSDVFHDDNMTFTQRRDVIVARFKATPLFKIAESGDAAGGMDGYELTDAIADLAESKTPNEFDEAWERIYDFCDTDHRMWINT